MNNTCRTAIAAAVAGGYVLGRTRKAKAAFAIGTLLAGRRFGLTPTALAGEGLRRLRESPQLADLREQIGGDLMDAARAAASASTDRRFSAFAGTLRDRVQTKDTGEEPEDEAYENEPDDGEAYEDEGGDSQAYEDREGERDEGERDEDEDEDERADRPAARRRGPGHERRRTGKGKGTAQKAAKKSAKKAAPASRAAAKKARPATKTASKKAASSRSRATDTRRGR